MFKVKRKWLGNIPLEHMIHTFRGKRNQLNNITFL